MVHRENVFANPDASSSAPYPQELHQWNSDDDELAKLLAIVVDRTGQPVVERSNSDHFSCSVRNVKSAQNQFPVITEAERMVWKR